MEGVNATAERRLNGAKRLDKPTSFNLGQFSKVLLLPHHDPTQGVLVLSQDRLLSKWGSNRQAGDFSIGRPTLGKTDTIEFRDEAVSTNHLKVSRHPDDFYYAEDRGSKSGTFEETIEDVRGETVVGGNGWAATSLPEQPVLQIGSTAVRIEKTGDKTFVVAGKRRMEIPEGTPFTIGAGTDNYLTLGTASGNPFDRVTVVHFDDMVFVSSSDTPTTVREESPGSPSRSQETTARITKLQDELEQEKENRTAVENQVKERDERISRLEAQIRRLRGAGGGRASGALPQLEEVLRQLDPSQQRRVIQDVRRSFGRQLHPDINPTADPETLKKANSALDDLANELKT